MRRQGCGAVLTASELEVVGKVLTIDRPPHERIFSFCSHMAFPDAHRDFFLPSAAVQGLLRVMT